MPRKKKITNNNDTTDDKLSTDSQNSQIEFNIQDLEETSGQELVNVLKRAVKFLSNIYSSADMVVEDDLLNKVIYLSTSCNSNTVCL